MTQESELIETKYISVSQLKQLHGFTDSIIKKFLGECDTTQRNPKSKSAAAIKMYSVERVNQVLVDEGFLEWKSKKENASLKRKQTIVNATITPEPKANANNNVITQSQPKINLNLNAFDFDSGLAALETADWVDFGWEHFRIEDDSVFSEAQKIDAVATVKKMLSVSYWFSPQAFFDTFVQDRNAGAIPKIPTSNYKSSILSNGWMDIPLVSLMIRDRQDNTKVMLDSGHHRWIALKELFDAGSLPANFKIPVYDLKRLRLRDQYNANLDFALRYAVTGGTLGHDFALRVIGKGWFTRLCTGVDQVD